MKRMYLIAIAAAVVLTVAVAGMSGCSKQPTNSGIPGDGNLALTATLTTPEFQQQIDLFRLRVIGIDFDTTFFLDFDGRYITGRVDVPAGQRLTFILTAEELVIPPVGGPATDTIVIYRGVTEAFVAPGVEVEITIALEPTVPMIRLSPKFSQIRAGDPVVLELTAHNIPNLAGLQVAIDFGYFNDLRLQPVRAALSRTLDSNRVEFYAELFNDDTQYYVLVNDTTGGRIVDAAGNGTLATIEFSSQAMVGTVVRTVELSFIEVWATGVDEDTIPSANLFLETSQVELLPLEEMIVNFADPDLEAAVRTQLETSGEIYLSDVLGITYFYASEWGITSLEGMEYLRNVEYIDFGYNNIVDLTPLRGLGNLRELNLTSNNLTDLSVLGELPALEYLDVSSNALGNSAMEGLSGATGLRGLTATYNNFSDLSFVSAMTKLTQLDVSQCLVGDLTPLSDLSNLIYLYMANNNVTDVRPLADLLNLYQVRLENNGIQDIMGLVQNARAGGLGQYDSVWLTGNPLSLDAQQNQIKELEGYGVTVYYGVKIGS